MVALPNNVSQRLCAGKPSLNTPDASEMVSASVVDLLVAVCRRLAQLMG